jgi:ribonuclease P protein component
MKRFLRCNEEFRKVYRNGQRYDRPSMTAFVLRNNCSEHRLGITASRKAIGNAVQRNRAKRVLRETFRLSDPSLSRLTGKYDWVLNAKRQLLSSKTGSAQIEFEEILKSVANGEGKGSELQLA